MKFLAYFLSVFLCTVFLHIQAQDRVGAVYYTGFDSLPEQTGWVQYRMGAQRLYEWNYESSVYASSPYCLSHGFMVHHIIPDTVSDWFVSPAIDLSSSSKLSVKIQGFTFSADSSSNPMLSQAAYFGIWYSPSDKDPGAGTFTELIDLTSFSLHGNFKDTANIVIPALSDSAFIAFVYKNVNSVYNINVDDVLISRVLVGIPEEDTETSLTLAPNPCVDFTTLEIHNLQDLEGLCVEIFSSSGRLLQSEYVSDNTIRIDGSRFSSGIYFIRVSQKGRLVKSRKLVIK